MKKRESLLQKLADTQGFAFGHYECGCGSTEDDWIRIAVPISATMRRTVDAGKCKVCGKTRRFESS